MSNRIKNVLKSQLIKYILMISIIYHYIALIENKADLNRMKNKNVHDIVLHKNIGINYFIIFIINKILV